MNINNTNSSNAPNISYEFFTIHTDSSTVSGLNGNNYTTHLFRPLKDVVQVSIVNAVFSNTAANISPVAYLTVDELQSQFNEITGNNAGQSNVLAVSAFPSERAQFQNPLAAFPIDGSITTQIYKQSDFSTQTQFISPIRKLDRITCRLWGVDGTSLLLKSPTDVVHISFRFTCLRSNLGPNKKASR